MFSFVQGEAGDRVKSVVGCVRAMAVGTLKDRKCTDIYFPLPAAFCNDSQNVASYMEECTELKPSSKQCCSFQVSSRNRA